MKKILCMGILIALLSVILGHQQLEARREGGGHGHGGHGGRHWRGNHFGHRWGRSWGWGGYPSYGYAWDNPFFDDYYYGYRPGLYIGW